MLKMILLELKQTYRQYFLSFALYLMACLVLPFVPVLEMKGVAISLIAMAFLVFVIVLAFNVYVQYYRSMFGRVGYLYQTLPLTVHELLISKIVATFIWVMIGILILLLGMVIMGLSALISFRVPFSLSSLHIDLSYLAYYWKDVLLVLFGFVISIIASIVQAFSLCTVVQTKYTRNHRIVWMVAIAFVLIILYAFFGVIFPDYTEYFFNFREHLWYTTAYNIVTSGLLYALTAYILEKKLEF